MAEYIPREAIMKMAIEEKRFVFQMEDLLKEEIVVKTVYKDFFDFIKSIPAADVAPVRHGRWIKIGYACGDNEYECSVCHETEWRTSAIRLKYCPYCGCKMLEDSDGKK